MSALTAPLPAAVAPDSAGKAASELRQAAVRSFRRPGRGWWLLFGACLLVVVNGVVAWIDQLQNGMAVAGYNDHAFWAIYIADVVTFIGVSYGGAVISAILRLTGATWRAPLTRLAEGMAVVTVLIGGAFIIPHLGRPDRLWEIVTRPNLSSPIFWDFIAISTYTLASIIFFLLPAIPDMAILRRESPVPLGRRRRFYAAMSGNWSGAPTQRRVLRRSLTLIAIMIIPLAVSVHSVLSWAFSLVSRPWWHDPIWAPYFVVAALYSGVGLVILVAAAYRRAYHLEGLITPRHFARLGYILATFAAAYLYLSFADILPEAYVGDRASAPIFHELLVGAYAPWFWIFVVAAGIVPLLLVAIPRTRTPAGMVVAAACVVPAMWLKRMVMVLDPATYDRITGTFGSYHFTWVSISITLAGLAAIPLLLMLMFRVFPIISIDEVEEIEHGGGDQGEHAAEPDVESGRNVAGVRSGGSLVAMVALGAAIALACSALLPQHASAAATPQPAPAAHLTLAAAVGSDGIDLTAHLTNPAGRIMTGETVAFFQRTTEFGPSGQLVPIGTASTDDQGNAEITYTATTTGATDFVARYGSGKTAVTSTPAEVTATSATPTYQPAPPKPLADVGDVLVGVLIGTVVLVWLTLIAQVVRVRRACARA